MEVLYYIAVKLYGVSIVAASSLNRKARLWVSGRMGWEKHIAAQLHPGEKRVHCHCSSLGEFEQGKPVLESLRKNFPEYKYVVTFFSPSGFEIRKNDPLA